MSEKLLDRLSENQPGRGRSGLKGSLLPTKGPIPGGFPGRSDININIRRNNISSMSTTAAGVHEVTWEI